MKEGLSLRGGVALFVIPAHAGIHVFCLCFFLFFDLIPANDGEMKSRSIVILIGNGFRLSPE